MSTNLFLKKNIISLFSILFIFCCTISGNSQTTVVAPNANTSTSNGGTFLSVYTSSTRTYQLIIDDSQLTSLVGKYLTSISFRLPGNATANWPATAATFPSYEVYLSEGVEPANRQLNFAANVVGTQTLVRSGSMVIPAEALTFGTTPNAFSYKIEFSTPWLYAGSNLVIEIRHTGNDISSSRSTEATGTSAAGYGTLYTACWQGTSGVVQGNFSVVQINAVDALGVKSVEIDSSFAIYPNPVKDILMIKSDNEISEFKVFNFAGQLLISEKTVRKSAMLNVATLLKGTYILQTIDIRGNSVSTKFIKE